MTPSSLTGWRKRFYIDLKMLREAEELLGHPKNSLEDQTYALGLTDALEYLEVLLIICEKSDNGYPIERSPYMNTGLYERVKNFIEKKTARALEQTTTPESVL